MEPTIQLKEIQAVLAKQDICIGTTVQAITTATGITAPTGYTMADISYMIIQVDEAAATLTVPLIRYTEDGTTPTNLVGKKISDGGLFDVIGVQNCGRLKVVKTTAAAAVTVNLQIAFYK
jgi:hypothetical protein